ncbi:MAG: hypothetical protein V3V78_04910 [Candidatus Woesearchaeota archaeon]
MAEDELTIIANVPVMESYSKLEPLARLLKEIGIDYLCVGSNLPIFGRGVENLYKIQSRLKPLKVGASISSDEQIVPFLSNKIDLFYVEDKNTHTDDLIANLAKQKVSCLFENAGSMSVDEWVEQADKLKDPMFCYAGSDMNTLAEAVKDHKVIFNPSKSCGRRGLIYDTSIAAVAMGAEGIIVDIDKDPGMLGERGKQCIMPAHFKRLLGGIERARNNYLKDKKNRQRFRSIQVPGHVDIYFKEDQLEAVKAAIGDEWNFEKYTVRSSKVDTGLMTTRIRSGNINNLRNKGFALGKIYGYGAAERETSQAVDITRKTGKKIHITPYSKKAVERTGRIVAENRAHMKRVEFVNAHPGDRIRDAYATLDLNSKVLTRPLVIYEPVKE